jgi:hypothetical protein
VSTSGYKCELLNSAVSDAEDLVIMPSFITSAARLVTNANSDLQLTASEFQEFDYSHMTELIGDVETSMFFN